MIAACKPSEKTIDIGNVKKRAGLRRWERDEKVVYDNKNGGALTSALLKVLYNHYHALGDYNYQQDHTKIPKFLQGDNYLDEVPPIQYSKLLQELRDRVKHAGLKHVPQWTSSRPIDLQEEFHIIPPKNFSGNRKALVIGINYEGQDWEIPGCQNDALNVMKYLKKVEGFRTEDITANYRRICSARCTLSGW